MKVLMTLVVVFVLAGCAAGEGDAGSPTTQEETTAYKEETTVLEGGDHIPRPPDSTLSYGGREVKGTLGTYCWTSGKLNACADGIGPGVGAGAKMLRVAQSSGMIFDYGGKGPLDSVAPTAYPIGRGNELVGMGGFCILQPSEGRSKLRSADLRVVRSARDQMKIPAELPPGEYVVDVDVTVQQGDASYYFRVRVE